MGFLGRLFGGAKATKDALGFVRDGIDAIAYTSEEKAHDAMAERRDVREFLVRWMESTKGQNLARRLISLLVVGMWVLLYAGAALMAIISAWKGSEFTAASTMLHDFADGMSTETLLVLAFYFGAGHVGKLLDIGNERAKAARDKRRHERGDASS